MDESPKTLTQDGSPFLTAAEAAEWLRMTESGLARRRLRGLGPRFYQPGGTNTRVFYRREDLDEWIESGAAGAEGVDQPIDESAEGVENTGSTPIDGGDFQTTDTDTDGATDGIGGER